MKSSSGEHFIALDQVRAVAALLVQGHTGVALFMALSGYLFAKLLDGKRISYPAFFWNRPVRIGPLLVLIVLGIGLYRFLAGDEFGIYLHMVKWGQLKPTLPTGAWSVTVELHFYMLLPAILFFFRRSWLWLPAMILAALALRTFLHQT